MISRHFVLAAGGTGGHMIPAHALAEELIGARPSCRADHRRARRPDSRPVRSRAGACAAGRAAAPAGRSAGCARCATSSVGRAMASRMYETFKPSAVIGFGGYPALPALLAARRDRIPTLIHEQNAVLGRVNRLLASRVDAIATAYEQIDRLAPQASRQGPSGRQSGARGSGRAARPAFPAAGPRTASSASW